MDGATDDKSIADMFKNIYSDIYNVHDDKSEVEQILINLDHSISQSDVSLIDAVTPDLVKSIISKLSANKNDVSFSCRSDGLKYGVESLAEPMADLFKACIVHGHISKVFLICALTPIVKDNTKSKTSSNNYRLIGISSLILKLFDFLLLNIFPANLLSSNLQFGFAKQSSTTMCTWTLNEVINYFTNRGSPVYICLLDMTKAFDNIKLSTLFEKLNERIPPLFLRLVIHTYIHQRCFVKWGDAKSDIFNISNGVRQGAVASPKFFNVYMDELFCNILESGLGCKIDSYSYSILGYADDLTLISPSLEGLQKMISMVEDYCTKNGLQISIHPNPSQSKTKCMCFNIKLIPKVMKVYGSDIPWVQEAQHLGHTINADESTDHDLLKKRAIFISKIHALRQELGDQHPEVFNKLVYAYAGSFYGSNLWDLYTVTSSKLYSAWNRTLRLTFQLPINTHRFILQSLYSKADLRFSLMKRFGKFSDQLHKCEKREVLHLLSIQKFDLRSTFGKNYARYSVNGDVGNEFRTPEGETWRVPIINELMEVARGSVEVPGFELNELKYLINTICID